MFILIFEQLVKMFFIMVLAFICYRIGLVDQNGNKNVSNLLLMVVNPDCKCVCTCSTIS